MNASEGYQLVQRLGAGVTGAVYLAETAGGRVVIRQFESSLEVDSQSWQSERTGFLNAGRAYAGLKHSLIVPVLDVIDEAGEAFVATEYLAGETLATAMLNRRLSLEEATEILRQVAGALDFAHERGVIHGDLRPSDIFLIPKRGAMVADFAISPRARWDVRRPLPASLVHEYLSPEHLRDPQRVTARSDQYSLAVVAYRMYTGRSPYGEKAADPKEAIRDGEIVPPSRVASQLPPAFDAIFLKALNRDPSQRFGSCREFFGLLGASLIEPSEAAGKRRRSAAVYAAAALIPVVGAAALLLWHQRTPSPQPKKTVTQAAIAVPLPPEPQKTAVQSVSENSGRTPQRQAGPAAHPSEPAGSRPTPFPVPQRAPGASEPRVDPPAPASYSPRLAPARSFSIEVFTRNTRIEPGSFFAFGDPRLGELALGDLKVMVDADGQVPSRSRLILEWQVNGNPAGSQPVTLKKMAEYGNEPTTGTYVLSLKLDGRPVQTFNFRITP